MGGRASWFLFEFPDVTKGRRTNDKTINHRRHQKHLMFRVSINKSNYVADSIKDDTALDQQL